MDDDKWINSPEMLDSFKECQWNLALKYALSYFALDFIYKLKNLCEEENEKK